MTDLILGCGNLSMLQMAIGLFFGAVFIPLQSYGFKAVAEILAESGNDRCAGITEIGAKATAFGGGTVHVLCVVAMFVCKMENTGNLTQIPQSVIDFSLWLGLPVLVLFVIFYLLMCIAMAIPIFKGKTFFPKWAVIFNPITGKIVLNALAFVAPNTPFFNAVRMGNMGVGSLITFAALWLLLEKYQRALS